MYNPATLKAAFSGVIGFLQSNIPNIPVITGALATSESGKWVQDKHPLVSLENLYYAAPDFNANTYPVWVAGLDYRTVGSVFNYNGTLYKSLNVILSDQVVPPLDPANWVKFNPFQVWLQQKFDQNITNVFDDLFRDYKLERGVKAILERQQLYRGNGRVYNTIVPSGRLVGFEIRVEQAEGLLVQLDMLGTQFTEAQNLNFYFYNTANPSAPLEVFSVAVGGSSNFKWSEIADCIMTYLANSTDSTYVFCYYESDLVNGNQAVSRSWDCASAPCASCDSLDLDAYNRWSRYTAFRNIQIPSQYLDLKGRSLPSLQYSNYQSNTNWGMNFSLTVRCDLTNFITYSKFLYCDVIAVGCALEGIKAIAFSPRIDPTMAQLKIAARAELDVKEPSSFINTYKDAIKALHVDMSGFSQSCQPCKKEGKGFRWRSN